MAVLRGLHRRLLLIAVLGTIAAIYFIATDVIFKDEAPETGDSFLEKVMIASGGKIKYDTLNRLTFKKKYTLYTASGEKEFSKNELHSYDYATGTNRLIQWKEDTITYTIVQRDTLLFQTKNNKQDTTITKELLKNKLNAATFVVGLPYTLNNEGSTKKYNGIKDFEGSPAHELEVNFKNSQDNWKMYYSLESLDWLGYWVHTSDHYSLVINEEMAEVGGFKFSRKRKSYRTDSLRKRLYLRADYAYSNFSID